MQLPWQLRRLSRDWDWRGEMLWLQRIKEWWRVFRDPVEKEKRKQVKRTEKIAKILNRNRQSEERQAENEGM